MTSSLGSYNRTWAPSAPGNYLLEASWSGNNQLAPSQSPSVSLTVTGSVQPAPTILSSPTTTPHGKTLTLPITVFNPAASALNAGVTIQITAQTITSYSMSFKLGADSHSTGYYDWAVPTLAGIYTAIISLLPPTTGGIDIETIQVT